MSSDLEPARGEHRVAPPVLRQALEGVGFMVLVSLGVSAAGAALAVVVSLMF